MPGGVSVAASMAESSSASQQSANNQNFSGLFGKKTLSSTDYTKPALILGAVFIGYLILKKKKLV